MNKNNQSPYSFKNSLLISNSMILFRFIFFEFDIALSFLLLFSDKFMQHCFLD